MFNYYYYYNFFGAELNKSAYYYHAVCCVFWTASWVALRVGVIMFCWCWGWGGGVIAKFRRLKSNSVWTKLFLLYYD